jgi:4-diphosphocytidyl-2-C-methyl-D-erythritol kinase
MTMSEQFTKINDGLLVRAPGKINLSLLVKGKRADGYHDIESIMAKIDWFDEILIQKVARDPCLVTRSSGVTEGQNIEHPTSNSEHRTNEKPVIELICKGPYDVPEGEENLAYKAAKLILETAGQKTEDGGWRTEGIRITLTKNMPAGSGLGSGSSDAAATLMGINKFFKLGLGKRELAGLAAKLGSDVAFFLDGPLALCTGRGEKVKKLAGCEFRVLLIIPDVSVSTKRVYENYRHDEVKYRRLREEINVYIEKKRIDLICSMGANMLQESCFELHTELGELKKRIESLGVRPMCLSGSGSSMFCIINNSNEEGVKAYRDKLERDYGCKSIIVNNNSW